MKPLIPLLTMIMLTLNRVFYEVVRLLNQQSEIRKRKLDQPTYTGYACEWSRGRYTHVKSSGSRYKYTPSHLFHCLIKYSIVLLLFLNICVSAEGSEINLEIIKQIESSGNPFAYNEKSGAIGLYQITPICLKEWNDYAKGGYTYTQFDLANPIVNSKIASWYINTRIPQMLKFYNKPITIENILISYNAGIWYVVHEEKLPKETRDYIKKYKRLWARVEDRVITIE